MTEEVPLIKVWLVEDDASYRSTISELIESAGGMTVSEALDSHEAAARHLELFEPPDIVLQDIGLPGRSGIESVRLFRTVAPDARIIMLTVHEDEDHVFEALCAGASGYLIKHAPPARIIAAIREVHGGGVIFSPTIAVQVLRHFETDRPQQAYHLTEREVEVLILLADGNTQKEIGDILFLSPYTVETHLRHVYDKLHVRNGSAAISKAIREHLI